MIPIEECPIAAPLLVRAALAAGEIVRELPVAIAADEISLFCDAARIRAAGERGDGGTARREV